MQRREYFLAPFIIILIGFFSALISSPFLGNWAFVILAVVYYACIAGFVRSKGIEWLKTVYAKPKLQVWTVILGIIVGFLPFFVFLTNKDLLNHPYMILWVIFGLVNPFFEETFWRGYIIGGLEASPKLAVVFSTLMFTLSHPLMWGVFSHTLREPAMMVSLLIMGSIWGIIYIKTKNLWICVFSHMLVDFFNMSIFSFLDMIALGIK